MKVLAVAVLAVRAWVRLLAGRCDVCGGSMRDRDGKPAICRFCGLTAS